MGKPGAFLERDREAHALRPVRERTEDLLKNKDYLEAVYRRGAESAAHIAERMLAKVYKKVGFVLK